MKKSINNKTKGFTIVELLVVIVVIGILAAISVVSYSGVTKKANAAVVANFVSDVDNMVMSQVAQGGKASEITTAAKMKSFTADEITTTLSGDIKFVTWATALSGTTGKTTLKYRYCTSGATGYEIGYWDFATGDEQTKKVDLTGCTGYSAGFAG